MQGPWVQETVPNPDYYVDEVPLKNIGLIGGIAFEVGKWRGRGQEAAVGNRICVRPSPSLDDIDLACLLSQRRSWARVQPLSACVWLRDVCYVPRLLPTSFSPGVLSCPCLPLSHPAPLGCPYISSHCSQLWTIDEGYTFDNIYVGQDPEEAARLRKEVWEPRFKAEVREGEGGQEMWGPGPRRR